MIQRFVTFYLAFFYVLLFGISHISPCKQSFGRNVKNVEKFKRKFLQQKGFKIERTANFTITNKYFLFKTVALFSIHFQRTSSLFRHPTDLLICTSALQVKLVTKANDANSLQRTTIPSLR